MKDLIVLLLTLGGFFLFFLFFFKYLISKELTSLKDKIVETLSSSQSSFFALQESINKSLGELHKDLGSIYESSRSVLEISRSFERVFRSPSPRGGIGETLLENIIRDLMPPSSFRFQYSFRGGRIADAVLFFPQGLLAIDSKFPLESFENYTSCSDEKEKEKLKKRFFSATQERINEASKYILPQEGTFDFSFMYVPSESIYYEIITNPQLLEYAHSKRVFVVSPSTLYAYLTTAILGFKGLKIEKEAKKILEHIKGLEVEITDLRKTFSVLGSHLQNALTKYNELLHKLQNISSKITYQGQ